MKPVLLMKHTNKNDDPFLRSRYLKEEATAIIHEAGLDSILRRYGNLHYTGSYFLDLMVWPDLDIELSLDPDPFSLDAFFDLGRAIAQACVVSWMTFYNRVWFRPFEHIPHGLYWNIRVEDDAFTEEWNIDLWSFEPSVLEANWQQMQKTAAAIDEPKRRMIIELKHSLLTEKGRTPRFSGYHIYQAVLFKGLTRREEIIRYLRDNGVDLT